MPEQKRVKQIVKSETGKEIIQKHGIKDEAKDIGSSLFTRILVPAAKDLLYDMIVGGASMGIYHDDSGIKRSGRRSSNGSSARYTSYNSISDGRSERSSGSYIQTTRGVNIFKPDNLSRTDCYDILDELKSAIAEYGFATVADYNQTIGHTSRTPKQDNRWGWEDLDGANIVHDVDGYYIEFPRMVPID